MKEQTCICDAYNCNKFSLDVYLYQITLENGLKCLHKFRYKSFNIGSWSLFSVSDWRDSDNLTPAVSSHEEMNKSCFHICTQPAKKDYVCLQRLRLATNITIQMTSSAVVAEILLTCSLNPKILAENRLPSALLRLTN